MSNPRPQENMNEQQFRYHLESSDRVKEIRRMDDLDKLAVYMDYYITNLTHKHLHGTVNTYSKDEFLSSERIALRDNGVDWKEKGYGQRVWVNWGGIYNWYWKFKDRINTVKNR